MKKSILLLLVVAIVAACGVSAMAAEDWNLINYSPLYSWVNTHISKDGGASWYYQGANAFVFQVKVAGGVAQSTPYPKLTTYCVDFTNVLSDDWYERLVGQKPSAVSSVPSVTDATWKDMAWLNQTFWTDSLTSANKSAGLQLALWDCLYDSGTANAYSIGAGTFQSNGTAAAEAQVYLTALGAAHSGGFTDYSADTVFYQDGQNQMGKNVPEIPTALLAPLGLGVVGLIRRRFGR